LFGGREKPTKGGAGKKKFKRDDRFEWAKKVLSIHRGHRMVHPLITGRDFFGIPWEQRPLSFVNDDSDWHEIIFFSLLFFRKHRCYKGVQSFCPTGYPETNNNARPATFLSANILFFSYYRFTVPGFSFDGEETFLFRVRVAPLKTARDCPGGREFMLRETDVAATV